MAVKSKFTATHWVSIIGSITLSLSTVLVAMFTNVFANSPSKPKSKAPNWAIELQRDVALIQESQDSGFSGVRASQRRNARQNRAQHDDLRRSIEDNAIDIGTRANRYNKRQ